MVPCVKGHGVDAHDSRVRRLLRGDEGRRVPGRAARSAGDAEGAEDAVAEAYERAFLRWEKLAGHANPTGWVIRTAINHRISAWRRHSRKGSAWPATASLSSDAVDPALLSVIRRLPRGQREVLALRVLLDFSVEQTAETLSVRPGTVKAQLHRALKALRLELVTREPEEVWQ